uniref:Bile acid:sodium symporter family protein n=1 Tax=Roseihalotalea indica TaxID=2867963 RepID=A0AA49GT32_9BACT|nr:bile acid:sodium symporter family protein [Tunicatimonas sp. TK19036]
MEVLDELTLHFNQQSLQLMNFCLGLVMFGVALELSIADFRRLLLQPRAIIVGLASQVLLLPAITYLLVLLIQPTTSVALGMLLVAACPGGNLSNMLTLMARGNGALSVSLTALATLLAVVTVPLNFTFWAGIYVQSQVEVQPISLSAWQMISTLLWVVGLPLLLGMMVNHKFSGFAQRIHRPMRIISLIIFGAFIAAAFAANFSLFLQYIHLLVLIVLAHNALAYVVGYGLGAGFGLKTPDRKAIALETGIQNSGLALVIIFSFFDGWGGMAFLAGWWGIWDIISGLLLAWGLSKVGTRPTFSNYS